MGGDQDQDSVAAALVLHECEIVTAIASVREEVDEHTRTLSPDGAAYVRHGYLLACELLEKRLGRASRRQVA